MSTALAPAERRYDVTRSMARTVVDERIVGDVVVGLFRMKANRYWFLVITSSGKVQRFGDNEQLGRDGFNRWVAAIAG